MAIGVAEPPQAASLADDFIKFEDSSSESDDESVAEAPNTSSAAGTKRSLAEADEVEEQQGTDPTKFQRCYNGQPVPPWLAGQQRLGKGKTPEIHTMLNEEVTKFVNYISPTPEEHQMRSWVIERMQNILDEWDLPGARPVAHCFGSFETKLYLPTSDIDLTIMIYNPTDNRVSSLYESRDSIRAFLYKLARQLKNKGFCDSCEVIAGARVPIIKTQEKISGIAVDISINADSGMKSAQVQKSFVDKVYPNALRSLVLSIKQFLYQRSMNEVYTGGMGSYAITLLAVSLLQMHPRIRSGGLDPSKNLGVLLIEFFELYGKRFNYDNVCVSVLDNGCYLDKRQKSFYNFTQTYLLSIEDPCDTSNDVTKGTYGINRIKQTFGGAYDMLNNAIFAYHQTRKHGKPINNSLVAQATPERSSKRIRGKHGKSKDVPITLQINDDPWAPVSFLSSILHVDSQTISMRRRLVDTFYKGTMQECLGVEYKPQLVKALDSIPDLSRSKPNKVEVDSEQPSSAQEQINRLQFDFTKAEAKESATVVESEDENPVFISDDEDNQSSDEEEGAL
ncbi:hypothetical protein IWW36_001917 [Coemansia brasiliensis]|uniref:polynucleotide adenylyltransferase n=1 Tax=Coemansia brasiliensis TaxID=2650707 RepID=A0A9W8IGY1_9FUNG|nr:hypothetical protein IWW36_001917 [Coemansia brasiliensis]